MARSRFGIQFEGFDELMSNLDEIGGSTAMKRGIDAALTKSKEYVNERLDAVMVNSKLPAKGKYSRGDTKRSIERSTEVKWQGTLASTKVGFNLKESGLTSIYLMYGTPKMRPVSGLKAAIYGAKTKREVAAIQKEALNNVIRRIMEG